MSHSINNSTINVTNNFFLNAPPVMQNVVQRPLPQEVLDVASPMGSFLKGFESGFASGLLEGFVDGLKGALNQQTSPVEPPAPVDSSHPAGSLTADKDGTITTPGGYKVIQEGQFNWRITGPDGSSTSIDGDPHVHEHSAGGKNPDSDHNWDFKADSTFMLPDGTKIDVKTKDFGNGMTVTSGLTVSNGNDRVQVTGIDQGKGKTGEVTHDAFQHVNDFAGKQVFVAGQNVSDWSMGGKEILGNDTGGADTFKLGKDLAPLAQVPEKVGGANEWASKIMDSLGSLMQSLASLFGNALRGPRVQSNPYLGDQPKPVDSNTTPRYDHHAHHRRLAQSLNMVADMLKVITSVINLTQQLKNQPVYTAG